MRPYRWTLVPLPFVVLALMIAVLSALIGFAR